MHYDKPYIYRDKPTVGEYLRHFSIGLTIVLVTVAFLVLSQSANAAGFIRGDANYDGVVDISDPTAISGYLYYGQGTLPCEDSADANDDGILDISDIIFLFSYLYGGGVEPPAPFVEPGSDPTDDLLGCGPEPELDLCAANNGGCDALTECIHVGDWVKCGPCPQGYAGTGIEGCVDIDECAVDNGGCDVLAPCINIEGGVSCGDCPDGYSGNGSYGCSDIDECVVDNGGCDVLTTCINIEGDFACSDCPDGYDGNGTDGCEDMDECIVDNGGCDPLLQCVNTPGSFECGACIEGYTADGLGGCEDLDECVVDNGGCDPLIQCVNIPGSSECGGCIEGYVANGLGGCEDMDECAVGNGGCDSLVACTNTVGSFSCGACPPGYDGNGLEGCVDTNECLFPGMANPGYRVVNVRIGGTSPGTIASPGLRARSIYFRIYACHTNTECVDIPGSSDGAFECSACPEGYEGDGKIRYGGETLDNLGEVGPFYGWTSYNNFRDTITSGCHDVDECATDNGGCDPIAQCVNTNGSHHCICPDGYTLSENGTCEDVNECQVDMPLSQFQSNGNEFWIQTPGGCEHQCTNEIGSHSCSCEEGYVLSEDGVHCVDIDECAVDNGGCVEPLGSCINTEGSFLCWSCAEPEAMQIHYDAGDEPSDAQLGDLDGDGHMDIVVTSKESDEFRVYFNGGKGDFHESVMYESLHHPTDLVLWDLDDDGDLDLIIRNEGGCIEGHQVSYQSYGAYETTTAWGAPTILVGWHTVSYWSCTEEVPGNITVHTNDGEGSFSTSENLGETSPEHEEMLDTQGEEYLAADLDGNGIEDEVSLFSGGNSLSVTLHDYCVQSVEEDEGAQEDADTIDAVDESPDFEGEAADETGEATDDTEESTDGLEEATDSEDIPEPENTEDAE